MTTEWIATGGKKPILPSHVFVYVRFAGDSREEAEAYRDGYGQSVDSVHSWADTIEYRRKHPAAALAGCSLAKEGEKASCPSLSSLIDRVRAGERSNALDVEIEVAVFSPDENYASIRPNSPGTKVIYRTHRGAEQTCWAADWTMFPQVAEAALKAREASL